MDENIIDWKLEASAVIADIEKHVKSAQISNLGIIDGCIYINLTTLEDKKYCVELSSNGFRIAAKCHDSNSEDSQQYFETPYSLLNHLSDKYRASFADDLSKKLESLT